MQPARPLFFKRLTTSKAKKKKIVHRTLQRQMDSDAVEPCLLNYLVCEVLLPGQRRAEAEATSLELTPTHAHPRHKCMSPTWQD